MKKILKKLKYFNRYLNGKCYNCEKNTLRGIFLLGFECLSCGELNRDTFFSRILFAASLGLPLMVTSIRNYIGISSGTWLLLYIIIWLPLVGFIWAKQKKLPKKDKVTN